MCTIPFGSVRHGREKSPGDTEKHRENNRSFYHTNSSSPTVIHHSITLSQSYSRNTRSRFSFSSTFPPLLSACFLAYVGRGVVEDVSKHIHAARRGQNRLFLIYPYECIHYGHCSVSRLEVSRDDRLREVKLGFWKGYLSSFHLRVSKTRCPSHLKQVRVERLAAQPDSMSTRRKSREGRDEKQEGQGKRAKSSWKTRCVCPARCRLVV